MTADLLALLQLCDSLFPMGAFSHSDGLEAATSAGQVATVADLGRWMIVVRDESLRATEGPAVLRAWRAAAADEADALIELDDEVHALRPSAAGREAMRAMGGRLLKTWQHIRPLDRVASVAALCPHMTLPVAFGVVSAASQVPERDAVAGYSYTRLAATLSAAMRLMPVGQHEGHALLSKTLDGVTAMVDGIIADAGRAVPLRAFMPALDIACMRQQYVHSRLFRS